MLAQLSKSTQSKKHSTYFALQMDTCDSGELHESQTMIHCIYTTMKCL